MARRHAEVFLDAACAARASRSPIRDRCFQTRPGLLRLEPHSEGLRDRIWWGAGSNATAVWAAKARHEPAELDAQERRERRALPRPAGRPDPGLPRSLEGGRPCARAAGLGQPQHLRAHGRSRPRLFRSRRTRRRPGRLSSSADTGRSSAASYAAEPDVLIEQLRRREAIAEAARCW